MADPETPSRPPLLPFFPKLKAGRSVDTIDLDADEVDSIIGVISRVWPRAVWARALESSVEPIDLAADEIDSFIEVISDGSVINEVGVEINTTQGTSPQTTSPIYAYEEGSFIEDNGDPISRYGVYSTWTPPPRWSEPSVPFSWAS